MTEPAAALVEIIHRPRVSLAALLELRRLTTTCLSSMDSSEPEGERDAAPLDATKEPVRRRRQSPAATGGGRATNGDAVTGAVDAGIGKGPRSGGVR